MKVTWLQAREWGWRGVSLFALVVGFLAVVTLYSKPPVIPLPGDETINVPREITEVQPQDVACKGSVSVTPSAQGLFYRAILGKYVLSWTQSLDRVVLTDGVVVDYPTADRTITACLIKRAKLVVPSQ